MRRTPTGRQRTGAPADLAADLTRVTRRGEAAEAGLALLATLADEALVRALDEARAAGPGSRPAARAIEFARDATALLGQAARSGAYRRWAGKGGRRGTSAAELRRKARRLGERLRCDRRFGGSRGRP